MKQKIENILSEILPRAFTRVVDCREDGKAPEVAAGSTPRERWIVTYLRSSKCSGFFDVFDCESDAVELYEKLLEDGCYSASISHTIRSTDYDCPAR